MRRMPAMPGLTRHERMTGLGPEQPQERAPGELASPPPWWNGTPTEWAVNAWLTKAGLPFVFRPMAAPTVPGNDQQATHPAFVVNDRVPGLVVEVRQEPGYATAAEAQATVVRTAVLQNAGYTVVGVLARDIQGRLDETMGAALNGVQIFG